MKTTLGLLLLILLIAVGCDDSTQTEQAARPVPADPPVVELPSITNTLDMTFKEIPAGTFMMGSPETEEGRNDDQDQHKVTITKAFYMQTTVVTQGQWKAVMGTEPWKGKLLVEEGPNYPVVYLTWAEASLYCATLSAREGKAYRLPTEAEWEYACRAGTRTAWSFGNDQKALGDYAWYDENTNVIGELYAHQVGLKKPNAFGLYDMHGNVFEWCHDYFGENYYKQSPEKDPTGPVAGSSHVLRGGGWANNARGTHSADRGRVVAGTSIAIHAFAGFRLVRELD
jgi:sulfatase modifying factor 1